MLQTTKYGCLEKPDTMQKDLVQSEQVDLVQSEKTLKNWSDITHLSVNLKMLIFWDNSGGISAQDAWIQLISCEVVLNLLKINFFDDWPPPPIQCLNFF